MYVITKTYYRLLFTAAGQSETLAINENLFTEDDLEDLDDELDDLDLDE